MSKISNLGPEYRSYVLKKIEELKIRKKFKKIESEYLKEKEIVT